MEIISDYYFMPYPYISKSSLATYRLCKYKFLRTVIQGNDPQQNKMMAEGTALHYLFNKFFDVVERDVLEHIEYRDNHDTEYSAVYNYFVEKLYSLTPPSTLTRNVEASIRAFARMEENHWYAVKEQYPNANEAWRFWYCSVSDRERNLINEEFMLFGTYDRIIREGEKIIISDYKSGDRPEKLVNERRDTPYTKELPNRYIQEGNMYVLLYILSLGYKFAKDPNGKYHFYNKSGTLDDDILKRIDYQTIFLGNDFRRFPMYTWGRKKPNMRAIESIINKSQEARNNQDWKREPYIKKCQWCHLYESECREVIELEVYRNVLQSADSGKEDVFFDE
jgi:hypothetical protein